MGELLEIRLFGSPEVWRGDDRLQMPRSKKARALLAYLVATEGTHLRGHLCDMLWDGPVDPRAELRWALAKIRPLLNEPGITRLVSDRKSVGFDNQVVVIDLLAVRALLPNVPSEASTEVLQQAAEYFRGPFLEGLDLPECFRFDAWCVAERETLRSLHDKVLRTLVRRLSDDPETALRHARDRLVMDPLSEEAHTDLVLLLAKMGRTDAALDRYERCRRMLALEFGRLPAPKLELARRALTHTPNQPAAHRSSESSLPRSTPIIGRHEECQHIERLIGDLVAGHPAGPLLVTGEPGIGKSWLLDELKSRIRAAGGAVVGDRTFEVERGRPYAVWVDALRAFGSQRIPAELRPELARLLPELGSVAGQVSDRNRLFDAVVRVLEWLVTEARPVAVVLDDIQWLDDASAALTHYVARATAGHGLLLVLAARDGELENNPGAMRLMHTLRRDGHSATLQVKPLNVEQTGLLVRRIACTQDIPRIFRESNRNPLFILEITKSLQQNGEVLSTTLSDLVGERLRGLEKKTATLIPWAAALGRRFDLEVLAAVTNFPPAELRAALEELERHILIRASDSGGYQFSHDVIRQVAYDRASAPLRRMVHLRIARALARAMKRDHTRAGEVAYHAALGCDRELAARACAIAGRHGLQIFVYEEVAALIERGEAHLDTLPRERRIALHLELLSLYAHPGMIPHRPSSLDTTLWNLLEEAHRHALTAQVRIAFNMVAMLCYLRGDLGNALRVLERSEALGRTGDPRARLNSIAHTARCLGMLGRRMDEAERLTREGVVLAEQLDDTASDCSLPIARALVHFHKGELELAREHFERALVRARRDRYPWWEYYCLSRLPMIELERGDPAAALARCETLDRVASRLGAGAEAPFATALAALARMATGDKQACTALDQAVAHLREADSQGMIAYAQNIAAQIDFDAGRAADAKKRSEEALQAATLIDQCSEAALARAVLARLSKGRTVRHHLEALTEGLAEPGRLSARAACVAREVVDAVSG